MLFQMIVVFVIVRLLSFYGINKHGKENRQTKKTKKTNKINVSSKRAIIFLFGKYLEACL